MSKPNYISQIESMYNLELKYYAYKARGGHVATHYVKSEYYEHIGSSVESIKLAVHDFMVKNNIKPKS